MMTDETAAPDTTRRTWALARVFVDHPASVDETYWQHARFAGGFAGELFIAAGAALVHAVIPCLCETTASRAIKRLNARMEARH